eukprot:15459901-Alexandrium_andersonii.AAC.1
MSGNTGTINGNTTTTSNADIKGHSTSKTEDGRDSIGSNSPEESTGQTLAPLPPPPPCTATAIA